MPDSSNFDINDVLTTAKQVIQNPAAFYRNMPREGGYAQPLIFLAVMGATTGLVLTLLSLFGGVLPGGLASGFMSIFIMPVAIIIGSFVSSAILFVIWKLIGSRQNYQTAFRCQAFASAIIPVTTLLGLIPYLGTALAIAWGIWLVINASIEVHHVERTKAIWVFAILGGLILISSINNERATRQMQAHFSQADSQVQESLKNLENMSPEEAGVVLGEFLKGLEQGSQTEPDAQTDQ